ncbi:hypothetical protein [Pseudanabaena sp. ABRG5-3]|uniref:hypothetical protein n=1 Tax=Pseudanabaena sp. ABRG5-3 TaxID=685565 RepID=UPI000DC73BF8|nr:hypothetical protein [Pseudanabaena sp. ABRG5-3]BBC25702.1 hypothetical protein ABRG53_3445 [Pseudanabaena sp. ABRG5-3]
MSKINKPSQSDDSNSKLLPRSVTPKPPIKDLPKLEVVKVIAPKSAESIEPEDQKLVQPSSEEPAKAVAKVIPASARVKTPSINRLTDYPSATYNRDEDIQENKVCLQPIPDATEPFQYRAIGVIYGRYVANADNCAKGHILTPDGSQVDAVLLGKIISIVKKRLQGDRDYLWVVYPRTNDKAGKLHVQISGVWAPVELGRSDVPIEPNVQDGYFSVRGEISSQSIEDNSVIVKVRRTEQKFDKQKDKTIKEYSKFKVRLTGLLPTDAVGQFWSVNVQRQGDVLTIIDGEFIGIVPYKGKRRPQSKGRPSGGGKFAPRRYDRPYSDRPYKPSATGDGDSFGGYPPRPRFSEDRPPVPKPLIKRKDPTE